MSTIKEPQWLAESRGRAERALAGMPLPTRKDENYRYLGLKGLDLERRHDSGSGSRIHAEGLPTGVVAATLGEALGQGWLARELELPKVFAEDPFALLAEARWGEGVVVRVAAGVKVERPVHGLHRMAGGNFLHRTLIVVEAGAELTYVDEFEGAAAGAEGFAAGLVQIVAREGSRVRYAQVQGWARGTRSFIRQHVLAAKGADVRLTQVAYGGGINQLRLETECAGEGAKVQVMGAARGDESQQFDFWIRAFHGVPGTASGVDYWAVMADKARAVFNGNMVITRDGRGTDAYQKNRNMLLSSEAEIDTHPKLEIAVDDVKCAHGASVSPVDVDQLFYLESRGIPAAEAELMIIDGFTQPVVDDLPGEELRERVRQALAAKHALSPRVRA